MKRDCLDGSDEDPVYCCTIYSLLLLNIFNTLFSKNLASTCNSTHILCVNPGSGPKCIYKLWMCDRDR